MSVARFGPVNHSIIFIQGMQGYPWLTDDAFTPYGATVVEFYDFYGLGSEVLKCFSLILHQGTSPITWTNSTD